MNKVEILSKKLIEYFIFNNRWLLLPFYLKLSWTLLRLAYYFIFIGHVDNNMILATLEDVDIVMIANLVKMIITGSYNSFIDREHNMKGETGSSGAMKIKLGTSLVGISSVMMLQTFMNAHKVDTQILIIQISVYAAFLLGALTLAIIEYLGSKGKNYVTNKTKQI